MAQKTNEIKILIGGELDASLARAIGASEREIKQLERTIGSASKLREKFGQSIFDTAGGSGKRSFASRMRELGGFTSEMGSHYHETGKKLGEHLSRGMEMAFGFGLVNIAETGIEKLKEFASESWKVASERAGLQASQHAVLSSTGRTDWAPELNRFYRQSAGVSGPYSQESMQEVGTMLYGADPKHFKSAQDLEHRLSQISNLGRDDATFHLAGQAYAKLYAERKLDAQELRAISKDTGMPIGEAILQASGYKTFEELSKAKKEMAPAQVENILDKALDIITGKGGAAYGHAESQVNTPAGATAFMEGRIRDIYEQSGLAIFNAIKEPMDSIRQAWLSMDKAGDLGKVSSDFSKTVGDVGKSIADGLGLPSNNAGDAFRQLIGKTDELIKSIDGKNGEIKSEVTDLVADFKMLGTGAMQLYGALDWAVKGIRQIQGLNDFSNQPEAKFDPKLGYDNWWSEAGRDALAAHALDGDKNMRVYPGWLATREFDETKGNYLGGSAVLSQALGKLYKNNADGSKNDTIKLDQDLLARQQIDEAQRFNAAMASKLRVKALPDEPRSLMAPPALRHDKGASSGGVSAPATVKIEAPATMKITSGIPPMTLNYAPTVHVQAASEQQIGLAVTNALEQHSDALSREIQRKSEMQGSIELHK